MDARTRAPYRGLRRTGTPLRPASSAARIASGRAALGRRLDREEQGLLALFSAAHATAESLTLAWDPSPEPGVAGYTLAYGTQSGKYTGWIDVGNSTSYTVSLADGNYWLAVEIPTELERYVVWKGSIALNGISLTIASINR